MAPRKDPAGEGILAGSLIRLGVDARDSLLKHLAIDPADQGKHRAVARVMEAFALEARTAVEEVGYFDADSRSEVAVLIGTAFGTQYLHTDRLHFFRTAALDGESLYDFVRRVAKEHPADYLGYCVVRPQSDAPIGRSLVPPTTTLEGAVTEQTARDQIRTAVLEQLHLFGIPLMAVGVPFMQQDGALLRCAHVSAWICHYAAVLRGAITRRTTAYLHSAAGQSTRAYPSPGLTAAGLEAMLAAADIPAQVLDRFVLADTRSFTWADRKDMELAVHQVVNDPAALERVWVRENLLSSVCRYLNSGMPVILSQESEEHTQVIVGYLREKDFITHQPRDDDSDRHSDVVAFITTDDRRGPFEVLMVDALVREIVDGEHAPTQIYVPLPRSLWMSGEVAEGIATRLIPKLVSGRIDDLLQLRRTPKPLRRRRRRRSSSPKVRGSQSRVHAFHGLRSTDRVSPLVDRARGRSALRSTTEIANLRFMMNLLNQRDTLTIRMYATTGVDFKDSFADRVLSASTDNLELAGRSGTAQMPRYVWVAEVLDRDARRKGEAPVLATLVLDATAFLAFRPERDVVDPSLIRPLLFQSYGVGFAPNWLYRALQAERALRGLPVPADRPPDAWFLTSTAKYHSGRWSAARLDNYAAHSGGQWKLASSGS